LALIKKNKSSEEVANMGRATGRICANINPELHQEIKIYAVKANLSVTEVIEQAFKEFLKNHLEAQESK
jgi:predicted HicB family RNase H-like nuclease